MKLLIAVTLTMLAIMPAHAQYYPSGGERTVVVVPSDPQAPPNPVGTEKLGW